MQGELHANLLRNNGITVSLQPLSAMPGMNSGIVLWVQDTDLAHAQRILANIDTDGATPYEVFDETSAAKINPTLNPAQDDNNGGEV
jgi:hypothetical protein